MGEYREYQPTTILKPFVSCLWSIESTSQAFMLAQPTERIVPNGGIELTIEFGDSTLVIDGPAASCERGFVIGQMDHSGCGYETSQTGRIVAQHIRVNAFFLV